MSYKIKDRDVRQALHKKLKKEFEKYSDTLILDEFGLCNGSVRIDVAVINHKLHGYEIKSEADTLDRLATQAEVYSYVMDRVTLVIWGDYIEEAMDIIPEWWGVLAVNGTVDKISFKITRRGKINPNHNLRKLCTLLWKPELQEILRKQDVTKKELRSNCSELHDKMIEVFKPRKLKEIVRETIKARGDWRDHSQPVLYVDYSRPVSML